MAIGTASNFQIYPDQVHGGIVESIAQNVDAFNAASRNTIRLVSERHRGNYAHESFIQNISGLISRRDNTSVSAATDINVAQAEFVSVKLNRTIGPVAHTFDAWRKVAMSADLQTLSFRLGSMIGEHMAQSHLNAGLTAATAALANVASVLHTETNTLTTAGLVNGLNKFGDRAQRIVMWVMHSKPFYDLVKEQIAANIDGVSNFNVAQALPITLNRPVLVTDDSALVVTGSPTGDDDYYTLGLVENGVVLEDSEEEQIVTDIVTGLDNLVMRLQGEFAFNCGLKGFQWDTTNGGVNPTDATLGTGSNWDQIAADVKDISGVIIQSK